MGGRTSVAAKMVGPRVCHLRRIRPRAFAGGAKCVVESWCELLGIPFENQSQGVAALVAVAGAPCNDFRSLPAVAPVVSLASGDLAAHSMENASLAIAVLSRCSSKVFIREKQPIITVALLERELALALPLLWDRTT